MARRFSFLLCISAVFLLLAMIIQPVRGAAIGRVLNKDHDALFAEQAKALSRSKERKPFLACPAGLVPCLANADSETAADDIYECVDVTTSLQSCGGCSLRRTEDGDVADGEGKDCTALPNVKSVECIASQCYTTSCRAGYRQTSLGCV